MTLSQHSLLYSTFAPLIVLLYVAAAAAEPAEKNETERQAASVLPEQKEASGPGLRSKGRRCISPWFLYRGEGSIELLRPNADMIASLSIGGSAPRKFIEQCHELDIETYLLVGGDEHRFDTPESRKETIDGYLRECREKGYDGIDLDQEGIFTCSSPVTTPAPAPTWRRWTHSTFPASPSGTTKRSHRKPGNSFAGGTRAGWKGPAVGGWSFPELALFESRPDR